VAIVHDEYQRVEPGPPYPSARLQHVCLGGHTVGAHALSIVSPMRYGRISFNSVTDEASKFARLQKIPYAPVHNLKFVHSDPTDADLNRHRQGLPPWSSKYQIRPPPSFPSSIPYFSLIAMPGLQLCQHFHKSS
jgi:hypothetical protein